MSIPNLDSFNELGVGVVRKMLVKGCRLSRVQEIYLQHGDHSQ